MLGGLIYWIIVGLVAGLAAGKIMKGGGYGIAADILLGIAGAIVGGWIFSLLGLSAGGLIGTIVVAIVGAVFLIWVARKIQKA